MKFNEAFNLKNSEQSSDQFKESSMKLIKIMVSYATGVSQLPDIYTEHDSDGKLSYIGFQREFAIEKISEDRIAALRHPNSSFTVKQGHTPRHCVIQMLAYLSADDLEKIDDSLLDISTAIERNALVHKLVTNSIDHYAACVNPSEDKVNELHGILDKKLGVFARKVKEDEFENKLKSSGYNYEEGKAIKDILQSAVDSILSSNRKGTPSYTRTEEGIKVVLDFNKFKDYQIKALDRIDNCPFEIDELVPGVYANITFPIDDDSAYKGVDIAQGICNTFLDDLGVDKRISGTTISECKDQLKEIFVRYNDMKAETTRNANRSNYQTLASGM